MIEVAGLWKVFGAGSHVKAMEQAAAGSSRAEVQAATGRTVAVRDVSFVVGRGETFVVMGLSGSGKSTLIRCMSRLVEPTAGSVHIDGVDLLGMDGEALRAVRRGDRGVCRVPVTARASRRRRCPTPRRARRRT